MTDDRTTGPEPPHDADNGLHWEAVPEANRDWRLVTGKGCRLRTGTHIVCGQPAVAELNRGKCQGESWWAYCADHLYGRWIENGQVMSWRLRADA